MCEWKDFFCFKLIDIIIIVISFVTLIVTFCIPIQIMKFQRYTGLMSTYMSLEFAHAYQSVINFFYDECGCNVEKIPEKYKERFYEDFKKLSNKKEKSDLTDVLHYQRRFLNDYFLELEMCRESSIFLRHRIHREWTKNEAWVTKILIYMNKVVYDDPEMFKDISCIKRDRMPKTKGLSKYLENFYDALKSQKRDIQV